MSTARVGSPAFKRTELGLFVSGGHLGYDTHPLTSIFRIGGDWIVKHGERWKKVIQISLGTNHRVLMGTWGVYNLLNSFEMSYSTKIRFGITHALRYENLRQKQID